jgi:hypothetical protein
MSRIGSLLSGRRRFPGGIGATSSSSVDSAGGAFPGYTGSVDLVEPMAPVAERLAVVPTTRCPDELHDAIVHLNREFIGREDPFSFRHQIAVAAARGDVVAVNNATAKWLASSFDVVFAANRVLHPGEKRLVEFATKECGKHQAAGEFDDGGDGGTACGDCSDVGRSSGRPGRR